MPFLLLVPLCSDPAVSSRTRNLRNVVYETSAASVWSSIKYGYTHCRIGMHDQVDLSIGGMMILLSLTEISQFGSDIISLQAIIDIQHSISLDCNPHNCSASVHWIYSNPRSVGPSARRCQSRETGRSCPCEDSLESPTSLFIALTRHNNAWTPPV